MTELVDIDSSVPIILLSQVRIPAHHHLCFNSRILYYILYCIGGGDENKQKDAGFGPYIKNLLVRLLHMNRYEGPFSIILVILPVPITVPI